MAVPVSTGGAPVTGPDASGFYWVQKTVANWPTFEGTGSIGQAVIQINTPGTYTFYYRVNNRPEDLIYLKDLWVFIFPESALKDRPMATSNDFVTMKVFPFSPNYAAALTFTVTTPGRYLVGFGPYNGALVFRNWASKDRTRANLGLKLEGPDGRLVDLESAVDLRTWRAPEGTIYVQQIPH